MRARLSRLAVPLAGFALMVQTGGADAAEIRVLSTVAFGEAWHERARLGRGVPNGEAVVRGESDIAVQQISELASVPGVGIVGPLIEFLQSPDTVAVLRAKGFEM
jgi:hypothetical protein